MVFLHLQYSEAASGQITESSFNKLAYKAIKYTEMANIYVINPNQTYIVYVVLNYILAKDVSYKPNPINKIISSSFIRKIHNNHAYYIDQINDAKSIRCNINRGKQSERSMPAYTFLKSRAML